MSSNLTLLWERVKSIKPSMIIAAFVSAFFIASAGNLCFISTSFAQIEFAAQVKVPIFVIAIVLLTAALLSLTFRYRVKRLIPLTLVCSTMILFTMLAMDYSDSVWFYAGSMLLLLAVFQFYVKNTKSFDNDRVFNYRSNMLVAFVLFITFTVVTSLCTVYRHKSMGTSCFDFGVFAQMFEYMRTTGLPYTTVERNRLLSHFAVHFSPFFYFLLPGYMLFPGPEYLLIAQSFCVGLGVLAIPGICRELGIKPKHALMFVVIYIFYPTLSYGLNYDFHENKFLTVCLIWTFYFMLKKKYVPMYITALMTCMVKEDAAIYIVAVSLFILFEQKDIKHGIIVLFGALVYFVFALKMVQVCGGGESEFGYRFDDFNTGGEVTIVNIIKTIFLDFGYGLKTMFIEEKFEFFIWMMIPVAFLPFFTRKISTLFLLTPMIFINFLSSWKYQYNIYYQYTFGAAALIIFSSIYVFATMPEKTRRVLIGVSMAVCFMITIPKCTNTYKVYSRIYNNDKINYDEVGEVVRKSVPKDASVTADGYIIPQICDYKELYLSPYNEEKTEYYLIDPMESSAMKTYESIQDEYTIIEVRARCVVLKRNDLIDSEEAKAVEEQSESGD